MRPTHIILLAITLIPLLVIAVILIILQGQTPDVQTIETLLPSDSLAN